MLSETQMRLTARERDVLELLARGLRHEQIAAQLRIGSETVRSHVHNASERLGAANRTQAVAIACGTRADRLTDGAATPGRHATSAASRPPRQGRGTRGSAASWSRCPQLAAGAAGARLAPEAGPQIAGCPVFPISSPWNQPVDRLPVAKGSATLIRSIGIGSPVHADFGSGLYDGQQIGIPYVVVSGSATPKASPRFEYASESDKGPYPIPADVPIEGDPNPGNGDRHALIVDRDTCTLYELYALRRSGGAWLAGSGAIWNLRSNALRPAGWTSADAAGLPILPGLARYDEVAAGAIDHALRFTAPETRRAYIYPARHFASDSDDPSLPPMGLRVRLKASFPIAGFPPQARIVLEALKRYGMILADNGSPWYISGAPDPRWSNDDLHSLERVTGADFEVVDTSRLRP